MSNSLSLNRRRIVAKAVRQVVSSESAQPQNQTADRRRSIVALIPRGEVIRNFVYSGTFGALSADADLNLLTIEANREIDAALREQFGTTFPLVENPERWVVRFQREILDLSHNRWVWSRAAQERHRLRDAEAVTIAEKSKRFVKKSLALPFANRAGLDFLGSLERTSSRLFRPDRHYEELYRELKPTLVFNGSHVHSRNAIQAVQAAQWMGIPTATFIFSWDNLTSQGRITLPYDHFLVWNQSLKRQLLEMYDWIREDQVFVTGTPQFDFHFDPKYYLDRHEYCRSVGADPARPIVLYTTGMANHMPGEPEIVEQIADMLNKRSGDARPQLLVRVYGKDRTGRFDELKGRRRDILFPDVSWESSWLTPKPEDSPALVNALRHCSLGINVASTVSLELCMFNRPVINVGYNPESVPTEVLSYADYYEFDHYRPIVESGAVSVAHDPDEMRRLINEALDAPDARLCERTKLIRKMFGSTLDGRSHLRVAEVLLELADREVRQD